MQKKSFTKLMSVLMATIIAITAIFGCTATVFATEETSAQTTIIEFDVTPERLSSTTYTFSFTDTYTDIDRCYDNSYLRFGFYMYEAGTGAAVGDEVAIDLKDYYGTDLGFTAYADKSWYNFQVPIYINNPYYFELENLTSSTRTLKVKLMITV